RRFTILSSSLASCLYIGVNKSGNSACHRFFAVSFQTRSIDPVPSFPVLQFAGNPVEDQDASVQAKGAVADFMNQLSHPSGVPGYSGRDVTAVLGPTNTGKTHLAIERLTAHDSGIIGLPLRLLAREVYARVC